MKRIITLFAFVLLFGANEAQAQDLVTEQWSLITEKTASWCPKCGSWGWSFKESLFQEYENDNMLIWIAHHSGDLQNKASQDLAANMDFPGQPVFSLNDQNITLTSANSTEALQEVELLFSFVDGTDPFVAAGIDATYDPQTETLDIATRAEFLTALEQGEYSLGTYIVRKEEVSAQSGFSGTPTHRNLVKKALSDAGTFGDIIAENGAEMGSDAFLSYNTGVSDVIDESGYANFFVVAVVWSKRVDGKYVPMNLAVNEISLASNTTDITASATLKAFASADAINLEINAENSLNNAVINVYNMSGQVVATQNVGDISRSVVQRLPLNGEQGIFIVRLETREGSLQTKVAAF